MVMLLWFFFVHTICVSVWLNMNYTVSFVNKIKSVDICFNTMLQLFYYCCFLKIVLWICLNLATYKPKKKRNDFAVTTKDGKKRETNLCAVTVATYIHFLEESENVYYPVLYAFLTAKCILFSISIEISYSEVFQITREKWSNLLGAGYRTDTVHLICTLFPMNFFLYVNFQHH